MSVATHLARAVPISAPVPIPERARRHDAPERLASVTLLYPPREPVPVGTRLTRRGVVVLTLAVLLLGAGLVWLARLSAGQPAGAPPAPRVVTVRPGDTLWGIAARVAPNRDPAAEVAALQRRNRITGVALVPGQILHVP